MMSKIDNIPATTDNQISQFYTPTELIHVFKNILDRQNAHQKIVWMKLFDKEKKLSEKEE